MDYRQAMAFVEGFSRSGAPVRDLSRIRALMAKLGDPQDSLKFLLGYLAAWPCKARYHLLHLQPSGGEELLNMQRTSDGRADDDRKDHRRHILHQDDTADAHGHRTDAEYQVHGFLVAGR